MSSSNFSSEAQCSITILRALTVSLKQPAKLRDLLREYRQMEGKNLQTEKFGFQKVEDFLRATGEFSLINNHGELCVSAHPSRESAHITQMVQRQKPAKKRGGPPPRMPFKSDQSWNKSSYSSNVFRNLPSIPSRRTNNYSNRLNQNNYNNNNNNNRLAMPNNNNYHHQQSRNSSCSPAGRSPVKYNSENNYNQNSNKSYLIPLMQVKVQPVEVKDLREHLNSNKVNGQNQNNQQSSLNPATRPILGQNGNSVKNQQNSIESLREIETFSSFLNNQTINQFKNIQINNQCENKSTDNSSKLRKEETFSNFLKVCNEKNNSHLSNKQKESSVNETVSKIASGKTFSVQNRLNIQKITFANPNVETASLNTNTSSNTPSLANNSSNVSPKSANIDQDCLSNNKISNNPKDNFPVIENKPKIIQDDFQFNPELKSVTSLEQYCVVKRIPLPYYEFLKPKFGSKRFQCRVTVNNATYFTYPEDYSNEETAKESCAKMAIDSIKINENKILVPICMDSDCELSIKIRREIALNYPNGIFTKNFPEVFEKTFNQSLPDHWFSIIQDSNQFLLESTADNNFILFANTDPSESSASNSVISNTDQDQEQLQFITNSLELPWNSKYWNVFITHCVSTIEIWARIVGHGYGEKFNSLLTDIEMSMLTDKKRPVSITIGNMYLVCISECWQRVRLEKIDKAFGKCLCFFVDFGDDDWLTMDQLFVCEKSFLELPAQAISFSLFGLEDFAENPIAKRHIDLMLEGKSLIAEILTKQEMYEMKTEPNENNCRTRIQIVLYDTSSSEDINLNPLLLNKICDETPPPEIKRNGVTNVNITHVNENGEVYMQVRSLGLMYVQNLISQLVQSKFKEEQHKASIDDIKTSNIFLIKDNDDERWYRGCLVNNDFNICCDKFNIYYVDYGYIKNVHQSQIFQLESLSTALSKFPPQAIKTKLHNLPPINSNIVARIKGLLRVNYPAIVKLAVIVPDNSRNVVPQTVAYVRVNQNKNLCNVNEAIRMENELESILHQEQKLSSNSSGGRSSDIISEMTTFLKNTSFNFKKISSDCSIPDIGELFNVLVTVSSNPYNFLVQSYSDYPEYQIMMNELQEYCKNDDEVYIPSEIIVGEEYAALRKNDDNYHRATVESKFPSGTSCICFIDCGDVDVVQNSELKILPMKFRKMPKQAINAKLYGIKPINGDWTSEDSIRFRELTLGLKFASYVKNVTVDNFHPLKPKVLELELIDVSTESDIYIHKVLIDEKRAIRA